MKEVISDISRWQAENQDVALATVINTWGSAPRKVGAKMALTPAGQISGSVSGGCVEGAVFEAGVAALNARQPELLSFGVADETAWEVGLACGGQIQVFVEELPKATYELINDHLKREIAIAVGTIIASDSRLGEKYVVGNEGLLLGNEADADVVTAIAKALDGGKSMNLDLESDERLFVDVLLPPPKLVMVGGVHIAVALTAIAKTLGYRTIVVDPRRAFGSDERFPNVDRLLQVWPKKAFAEISLDQASAVAMLTHDPKIDDPALQVVLQSKAFYIGALGSRGTQTKRRQRLSDMGFDEAAISRIHGPIGLDINAQTPEEIAVAIMAEIIAARHK